MNADIQKFEDQELEDKNLQQNRHLVNLNVQYKIQFDTEMVLDEELKKRKALSP